MKKTRGKKKKVSSSKKIKNFFIFKNKVAPIVFIVALLALAALLIFFNHPTGNTISGNVNLVGNSVLDNPAPAWVASVTSFLGVGETWKQVIIGIIIMLIIFAALYDMIELTSIITNNWVIAIIAAGLAIIFALVDIVRTIATWLFTFAATLGAIGIFLEIVISIFIFIGLSFGGNWIARWSAKRQANRTLARGIRNAGKLESGVAMIKAVEKAGNKGTYP
jgi:hypothetical protein